MAQELKERHKKKLIRLLSKQEELENQLAKVKSAIELENLKLTSLQQMLSYES